VAQIVPPVQAPVGSQVVEKPAEQVRAVATSLMTAAAVSSSLVPVKDAKSGGRRCQRSLLMMMPQCPHRVVLAVAAAATAAVPLAVDDHRHRSRPNSCRRRM